MCQTNNIRAQHRPAPPEKGGWGSIAGSMTTVVWPQLPLRLARVVIMLLAAWCMVRDGPRFVALGSCCVVRHTRAGKGKRPCWFGESLAALAQSALAQRGTAPLMNRATRGGSALRVSLAFRTPVHGWMGSSGISERAFGPCGRRTAVEQGLTQSLQPCVRVHSRGHRAPDCGSPLHQPSFFALPANKPEKCWH